METAQGQAGLRGAQEGITGPDASMDRLTLRTGHLRPGLLGRKQKSAREQGSATQAAAGVGGARLVHRDVGAAASASFSTGNPFLS